MKSNMKRHDMHILFPILLLILYLALAFSVVVYASTSYEKLQRSSASTSQANTALAYLVEKSHQGLAQGTVELTWVEGIHCLKLHVPQEHYATYIYQQKDALMELVVLDDAQASLAQGTGILQITSLTMEETMPGLLSFTCTDPQGHTYTRVVNCSDKEDAYEISTNQ